MFGIGMPMIMVGSDSLFAFTTFTFTNASTLGRYAATLSTFQAAYAGEPWLSSYYNMTTNGYQLWTVPASGSYEIKVAGSRGGNVAGQSAASGNGAIIQANVSLTKNDVLTIICGQYEDSTNTASVSSYYGLGGGGGSFVSIGTTLLIGAGGGGGAGYYSGGGTAAPGSNGQTTLTSDRSPGAAGYGGTVTSSYGGYYGAAGGGWLGNGENGNHTTTHPFPQTNFFGEGGYTYSSGFYGGDYNYSWGNPTTFASTRGGFGGGGGGNGILAGGAGGGYSGGGMSYNNGFCGFAGGGGSYIISSASNAATSTGNYNGHTTFNGVSIINLSSYRTGAGYVTITKL